MSLHTQKNDSVAGISASRTHLYDTPAALHNGGRLRSTPSSLQQYDLRSSLPFCRFFTIGNEASELDDKILRCPYQNEVEAMPKGSIPLHVLKEIENRGDQLFMVDGSSGEEMTCSQLKTMALNLASGLRKRGFRPGDVVCLVARNSLLFPVVFLGVTLNKGVLSMASPAYNTRELTHQMENSGATWLFVDKGLVDNAREVAKNSGTVRNIFILQGETEGVTSVYSLLEDSGDMWTPDGQVDPETDLLLLFYSSGTTGLPKGVMVTHRNMAAAYSMLRTSKTFNLLPEDVALLFLPMYHSFGFLLMFNAFIGEHTTIILPGFDPPVFLGTIQNYKVTFIPMAPPVVLYLAQAPRVDDFDLSSVRLILCGAAPLSADTQKQVKERLGSHLDIRQGYGLTESATSITLCSLGNKMGSTGQAAAYIQIIIVDSDTRARLGPHQSGEIYVRGPQITPGYYTNKDATLHLFDEEGWMRTGDVGYYDEDGYVFIIDRIKELIKYKGFQVAPAELEGLLLSHPAVADAGVVGRPDDRAGELPMAFVVLRPGESTTEVELQQFIADQVSDHKELRGGAVIVDSIKKNPSGKILRKALREVAKSLGKIS